MGGWQWGWGCRGVNGRVAVEMGAVVVVGIGGSQTLAFTDGLVGFPGLSHFPSEWRQPGGSWALKPGPHTEGWPELPVPPSVSSCGPLDSAAHAPRSPLQGSGGGDTWWMPSGRSPPPRAVSQARPESSSRLPWPCASLWGWEPQGPGGEGISRIIDASSFRNLMEPLPGLGSICGNSEATKKPPSPSRRGRRDSLGGSWAACVEEAVSVPRRLVAHPVGGVEECQAWPFWSQVLGPWI